MRALVKRRTWLAEPLSREVDSALERLEQSEDVVAVAVMPDVHLSHDVCIGTVTATRSRLFVDAVGGDIGCGMQAMAFDASADEVDDPKIAAQILTGLYAQVPILKHREWRSLPAGLDGMSLSASCLERHKTREAARQLGTIGRGNHFVELQKDDEGQLWAMVHSGSRAMGQAIRQHHGNQARSDARTDIRWLDATEPTGQAYLQDVSWARSYAVENRNQIMARVGEILEQVVGAPSMESSRIDADHNHVQAETHDGKELWVHRKGAQAATPGSPGIIPGSMGTQSFHVEGRGHAPSLCSSSHGAGRAMSRTEARRRITRKQLAQDTLGVWYDHRIEDKLREEAPAAYKDIGAVMRAQRDLVRVIRRLRPLLVYKGT